MLVTEFENFYKEAWKFAKPRLRNLTDSQEEIEDVFSEAIARFWVNLQSGKIANMENLTALVYVMAKNIWLGQYRKKKQMSDFSVRMNEKIEYLAKESEQDILTKMIVEKDNFERDEKLQRAFDKLDQKCKDLLNATIVYKERKDELLNKMDYKNADTIKASKYRCLQYLKKYYFKLTLQ